MNLDPHFPNYRPYQPTRRELRHGNYFVRRAVHPKAIEKPSDRGSSIIFYLVGALFAAVLHPEFGGIVILGFIAYYLFKKS